MYIGVASNNFFLIFLIIFFHVILSPGFENNGEWDEYPSFINSEGLEIGSPVRFWLLFLISIYSVCNPQYNVFFYYFCIRVSTMIIHLFFSILDMASTHKYLMDHIPQLQHLCLL